jgi:hypothetical protein
MAIGFYVRPLRRNLLPPSEYSKNAMQKLFLDQFQDEGSKFLRNSRTYVQPTWRHLPEVWNRHQHYNDSLKSSKMSELFSRTNKQKRRTPYTIPPVGYWPLHRHVRRPGWDEVEWGFQFQITQQNDVYRDLRVQDFGTPDWSIGKVAIPNLQIEATGSSETAITTTLHNTTFQRPYLSH